MAKKVILWLWLGAGLILVTRTAANVIRLREAGRRVEEAQEKLDWVKAENEALAREWQEAQTPEYMERQVREVLGYGRPGEVVLVIPHELVEGGTPPAGRAGLKVESENAPNWKQWRKLYLGF